MSVELIISSHELQDGDTIKNPKTNEIREVYRVDTTNEGYINIWWSEREMDRYQDGSIFKGVA